MLKTPSTLAALLLSSAALAAPITTGSLLEEMADLEKLARWPQPEFKTVQFSSYDRRSTTPEAPNWFANADGFGNEPIPNFQKVLREPREGQPGLYLIAEIHGPGAIVRGWSAGMGGTLRVYVDPSANSDHSGLIWESSAYDFLARRSKAFLDRAGIDLEAADAFTQQDADYLPIPFQRGLKVTYEGNLKELHFYHLQVRLYPEGTPVRTFDPKKDLKEFEPHLRAAVDRLCRPAAVAANPQGESMAADATLEPGKSWTWSPQTRQPGAIRQLKLRLQTPRLETALRGCLLRISFDDSQRPQVEAPVGDFFGSGPGVNPFSSLPFTVEPDGTMTCRFVMPYEKTARLEVVNYTDAAVQLVGSAMVAPGSWDERSLYFRAKWRADHDLLAGAAPLDLPFLLAIGQGRFVGCAAMIMNPSGVPTAGGNWWGEGDEKFVVDGEKMPSTFGTGSEDYFNYAWSRPDLFDHPYCGQPLDSGPDTAGYVSNHRFQVMDAISFQSSIAVLIELWSHNPTPGLSYARIAYHYARPGAVDDHRALVPSDLRIPPLPRRSPVAAGGARGAQFFTGDQLRPVAEKGRLETVPLPLATQLQVTRWTAANGDRLKLTVPVQKAGKTTLHLVAVHQPGGAVVRALLDGKPIATASGDRVSFVSNHAPRVLNVNFKPVDLPAGDHELVLECLQPGTASLDYLWVRSE